MTRLPRFLSLFLFTAGLAIGGAVPAQLTEALRTFSADGTKGWSFTQTTVSGDKNLTEHFDAEKPDFARWSLIKKDGSVPTAEEIKSYQERFPQKAHSENTTPNVKDQLDLATCETVSENEERGVYRFRLKPADKEDKSAAFMAATFTLHKPTKTIERVELANVEPFAPMFSVKIQEAKTVINYSLPDAARPTLLQQVVVKIRGRAMWIKSLDEDMIVTYSDYTGPRTPAPVSAPATTATTAAP